MFYQRGPDGCMICGCFTNTFSGSLYVKCRSCSLCPYGKVIFHHLSFLYSYCRGARRSLFISSLNNMHLQDIGAQNCIQVLIVTIMLIAIKIVFSREISTTASRIIQNQTNVYLQFPRLKLKGVKVIFHMSSFCFSIFRRYNKKFSVSFLWSHPTGVISDHSSSLLKTY